jgi:outer membrane protein insertion porin family
MFGIGYSDADGALFQTEIVRENLFGTGRGLKFKLDYSKVEQVFDIEYRNPYQTPEGISQALFLRRDAIDTEKSANADYISDTLGAGIRYRIPITEYNALNLTAAFEQIALSETDSTPAEYTSFIDRFPDNTNVNLTLGVSKDTRDSIFFPAEGYLRRISMEAAVPGSDLEYFKVSLRGSWHRELLESVVLGLRGDLGYGAGYRDQQELPFFKNYFAGGANSVRGHDARSLGPRSSNSNNDALGGNKRLVGNAEVLVPVPGMVDSPDKRLSLFFDGGQVFGNEQSFDISDLRYSAGVGFHWFSPVGPISLTYALPLNDEPGDDVEKFQFTLGAVFR